MNKLLKFKIIALDRIIYEGDVQSVTLVTTGGEINILPEHMPIAAILVDAPVKVIDMQNTEVIIAVHSGYVTMKSNELLIVADAANFAREIDLEREKENIKRNKAIINDSQSSGIDVARAKIQLQRSLMNLKIHQEYKK